MKTKILVTGGSGLLGKTLQEYIPEAIYLSSKDCDLQDYNQVVKTLTQHKPNLIIHLAARAGGIIDNINKPCEYLEDNILMNTNVLRCAREMGIKDVLSMSSTCVYPMVSQSYPMDEKMILEGRPEPTNEGYAYSKRIMILQSIKSNEQYGTNFKFITPCNLYGETDNFHNMDKAHFVTALMLKIHNSLKNKTTPTLYGDGTPIRQFLHVKDLSIIIKRLIFELGVDNIPQEGLNVCTDESYSIDEMCKLGYEAIDVEWTGHNYDSTKPNGVHRKDVSNKKLKSLLHDIEFTKLKDGMEKVYNKIIKNDKISQ